MSNTNNTNNSRYNVKFKCTMFWGCVLKRFLVVLRTIHDRKKWQHLKVLIKMYINFSNFYLGCLTPGDCRRHMNVCSTEWECIQQQCRCKWVDLIIFMFSWKILWYLIKWTKIIHMLHLSIYLSSFLLSCTWMCA